MSRGIAVDGLGPAFFRLVFPQFNHMLSLLSIFVTDFPFVLLYNAKCAADLSNQSSIAMKLPVTTDICLFQHLGVCS